VNPISGKTVLVTGGTGSFGSTFVRHALANGAQEVRVLSRDEAKQDRMREELRRTNLSFYLGDTRDSDSVRRAVRGSDLIFHAAAVKQVPSAEFFPAEAVKTNFFGSKNVLDAAFEYSVSNAVFLSTDKAVYPINAMGQSKALMEKLVVSYARQFPNSRTRLAITRYGNVLYSRGSVVPRFYEQAMRGDPLTLTDGSMTRFLMTLDESVDLVLQAVSQEDTGVTLVRKAPATSIRVLAEAVLLLASSPNVKIQEIGFRHGEKLFETLLSAEELPQAKDLGDYFAVSADKRDLNYERYFSEGMELNLGEMNSYNSHNTKQLDLEETIETLKRVPEVAGWSSNA
jgi:UDP-N-acetylglucosamine 4,6-dehydratase